LSAACPWGSESSMARRALRTVRASARIGAAMLKLRPDPFPFEAVRDLLGVLRAMYGAARSSGAGRRRIDAIRRVGLELRAATDSPSSTSPKRWGTPPLGIAPSARPASSPT